MLQTMSGNGGDTFLQAGSPTAAGTPLETLWVWDGPGESILTGDSSPTSLAV